ncbi:hypothetical protein AB5J56_40165 [Streptomyces sp. R21]|uniref:Uncharacterized protein n=1 Tax=Streptomyces sp. R21 TaxID=3238627 RepID=A0AB39PLQ2_9ACTN
MVDSAYPTALEMLLDSAAAQREALRGSVAALTRGTPRPRTP